jgi:hypothetical protein
MSKINRAKFNAKRAADPEFNENYLAKRRAQKSRRRRRIKAEPEKYTHLTKPKHPYSTMTTEQKAEYSLKQTIKNWAKSGWTPDAVAEAHKRQESRCAICGAETKIVPDHAHTEPPKPRALLCGTCNRGLGQFKDSPEICEKAAAYLRYWSMPCSHCGKCLDCLRLESLYSTP